MNGHDDHTGIRSAASITRRSLLAGLASAGLVACMPRGIGRGGAAYFGVADPAPFPGIRPGLFSLGVASGDPTPDGFVLWTRLAPDPLTGGGMPEVTVRVRWQVADDPDFVAIVADGETSTSAAVAHSVHIDVSDLPSDRTFYYRFTTGGQVSPVGRTRTAPAPDANVDGLRLVFATCQHYEQGHYSAWSHVAADQPDVVVFLGDYIYEGGISNNRVRRHNSAEVTDLVAYRNRYALYKADPDLQAAHAAAPWIVTWDDHEVENNYAGLVPQDEVDQPTFAQRRSDAYQAYWEHQPLRSAPDEAGNLQIFRNLQWGTLADFIVLDGRQHRSDQACGASVLGRNVAEHCADRTDPARTMLGTEQLEWLDQALAAERGRWSIVGNQTILTPMPIGPYFNQDQWDGYDAERSAVLAMLARVRNPVVLTGDMHIAGIGQVREEPVGSPVVATELIATSISSATTAAEATLIHNIGAGLPQFSWFNGLERGYCRADVTPDAFDVDYVVVDALQAPPAPQVIDTSWRITDGEVGVTPR